MGEDDDAETVNENLGNHQSPSDNEEENISLAGEDDDGISMPDETSVNDYMTTQDEIEINEQITKTTETFNALFKKPYNGKPMTYVASDRFDTMKRVYVSGTEDVFRPPINCNITPELGEKTREYHDRTAEWIKKTYANQDTP